MHLLRSRYATEIVRDNLVDYSIRPNIRGVIKNRAKDNSHYWVQATIMQSVHKKDDGIKYTAVRHLIPDSLKTWEM